MHIGMSVFVSFKNRIKSFHIPLSPALTIGSCIGFAAAFREPVLGITYLIEMYGVQKSKKYLAQNIFMLFLSIYIARYILEEILRIPPIIFHLPHQVANELLIFATHLHPAKLIAIVLFAATAGAISANIIKSIRCYSGKHFHKLSTKTLILAVPINL